MLVADQVRDYHAVNAAFTKQSKHYDEDDEENVVLTAWRRRVYQIIERYLKPNSNMLEINSGTGIDATYFVRKGHQVLATDIADGMIEEIKHKASNAEFDGRLSYLKCSFESLHQLGEQKFDYIFSNFGGLNCAPDLTKVTHHFSSLLQPMGFVTLVIMPKSAPWEWLWFLKGATSKAIRRYSTNGAKAHLEGEYFQTYYHTYSTIRKALGPDFKKIKVLGLGVVSPPPGALRFVQRFGSFARILEMCDRLIASIPPFNRWGDHIIVTFQYLPKDSTR